MPLQHLVDTFNERFMAENKLEAPHSITSMVGFMAALAI
jgi:hypothetical protein